MTQVVVVSVVISAVLAFFGAIVVLAIPTTEQLIGERICAPNERLALRRQTINLHTHRTYFVCQGASENRTVGMQPYGYAYLLSFLALTPLMMLIGAVGQSFGSGHRNTGSTARAKRQVSYVVHDEDIAARIERVASDKQPNLRDVAELLTSISQAAVLREGSQSQTKISVAEAQDAAQALRSLQALLDEELISREEYDHKRAEVLAKYFGGSE